MTICANLCQSVVKLFRHIKINYILKTTLVITSIASGDHPVLKKIAAGAMLHGMEFILIGDTKSPEKFSLDGCDFYSVDRQKEIDLRFSELIPVKHYSRKNLGYLKAMTGGAEVIVETDDDNIPAEAFWSTREKRREAQKVEEGGWVNVYKYFTDKQVWPRGFPPDMVRTEVPSASAPKTGSFPVQQGLADGNPDVDALYRLVMPAGDIRFGEGSIAAGKNTWCPFNSQNTTWFREAFPLMYLPSYCSFRMTDIWRSFVAQRIAWTCGWDILFHGPTVYQERNEHNLMKDFGDEVPGYLHNARIAENLGKLKLPEGTQHIGENLLTCYRELIRMGLVGEEEMKLVEIWKTNFEDRTRV